MTATPVAFVYPVWLGRFWAAIQQVDDVSVLHPDSIHAYP